MVLILLGDINNLKSVICLHTVKWFYKIGISLWVILFSISLVILFGESEIASRIAI